MARGDLPEFLAVVGRRADLLGALDGRAVRKPELEAELDVSRSTIDRGIRELEQRALVERTDGGYQRTLAGTLALEEYDRLRERVEGLARGGELLAALDRNADLDSAMLADATIVERERTSPYRPVEELYDVVDAATEVRAFDLTVHPQQVGTYRRNVENGMETELVFTAEVIERLVADHGPAFEETVETNRVGLWQAPEELPYGLVVAETPDGPVAVVVIYSDQGVVGYIRNDDPEAVAWARRRFERERERATRLA